MGFSRRVIRPVGVVNVVEHRPGHATHRLLVPVDQRPEGGSIARKRAYHQGDVVFTTGDMPSAAGPVMSDIRTGLGGG